MKVLHFVQFFAPIDQMAGMEIYVLGLSKRLKARGISSEVLHMSQIEEPQAEDAPIAHHVIEGIEVSTITVNRGRYSRSDPMLSSRLMADFQQVLAETKPDLVHFHPVSLTLIGKLMEWSAASVGPVVMTYHVPGLSCSRGDLLYLGKDDCDGILDLDRCLRCAKESPDTGGRKLFSQAQAETVVTGRFEGWRQVTSSCHSIVVTYDWAEKACLANTRRPDQIVKCRYALRGSPAVMPQSEPPRQGPIKFGCLSRINSDKGIGPLLDALEGIPPELDFTFEFYSPSFTPPPPGAPRVFQPFPEREQELRDRLAAHATRDPRIRLCGPIAPAEERRLFDALASFDALVVPSLFFETGPQVIYEAFGVRTPVIGARRGGIAELVSDGKTGYLFKPGDVADLRRVLVGCASAPVSLRGLRQNIPIQRTMDDVTAEMAGLYGAALTSSQIARLNSDRQS